MIWRSSKSQDPYIDGRSQFLQVPAEVFMEELDILPKSQRMQVRTDKTYWNLREQIMVFSQPCYALPEEKVGVPHCRNSFLARKWWWNKYCTLEWCSDTKNWSPLIRSVDRRNPFLAPTRDHLHIVVFVYLLERLRFQHSLHRPEIIIVRLALNLDQQF